MSECQECCFVEEEEPSGRKILTPCINCGATAMDGMADAKIRIASMESDLANAKRQAMESQPDYPWDVNANAPMSQIAWALCQALKGTTEACGDLRSRLATLETENVKLRGLCADTALEAKEDPVGRIKQFRILMLERAAKEE